MMTPLTIAVQCHNFENRLYWMLSSLAEQSNPNLLVVDVACLHSHQNKRTVAQVCQAFDQKLTVHYHRHWDWEQFQYRGVVRNQQLKDCKTPWLMFGDCDMVYHPQYFEKLVTLLTTEHATARYMLSSGRISNPLGEADALMEKHGVDGYIAAFALAATLTKVEKENWGAGYSQIINVQHCPHRGFYVNHYRNMDEPLSGVSNFKSDVQFRKRIAKRGGTRVALPQWFTDNAIHLNHERDLDAGKHLETQQ